MVTFPFVINSCPTGKASDKVACGDGEYAGEQFIRCLACDAGYTCKAGAAVPNPPAQICPAGKWCDGEKAHDCPVGTYNEDEGGKTLGKRMFIVTTINAFVLVKKIYSVNTYSGISTVPRGSEQKE